jgi:small GTP-binding protein
MSLINYASKEVTLKIVYYGPGLSGKTTNLQYLHANVSPERRGKLLSLATESDRTLFFDFMPMTLGKIGDFTVKFQLYTVPGQVRYNATRKLVLKGADAVVFVADSQKALKEQNLESYENMLENLRANNLNPEEIPVVLQYNKRDLDEIMSIKVLNKDLNSAGHLTINAEAVNGTGVEETFQLITQLLIKQFASKHKIGFKKPAAAKEAHAQPPKPVEEHPAPTADAAPPPPQAQVEAPAAEEKPEPVKTAEAVREEPAPPPPPPQPKEVKEPEFPEESAPPPPPQPEEVKELEFPEEPAPPPEPEEVKAPEVPEAPAAEPEMPALEERPSIEKELEEVAFAKREMPSIDELTPVTERLPESADAASAAISGALSEITALIKESQLGGWMEKLVYSVDSTKQTLSELVSELKASRKNQETMIDLLKKIETARKSSGKAPKKS